MSEILDVTGDGRSEGVHRAGQQLRRGRVIVLPTDTRYGLAADAFDHRGTRRVFLAKGSVRRFPLPVMVRSPKQLAGLTPSLPEAGERLVAAFWPGPLTIVVTAEPNLRWDIGDSEGTVAVRMPLDDVALEVIRAVGPLAVTSANRWGRSYAATAEAAREQLGEDVALYLDDGPREAETPSTIVDVTRSEPHVLREGVLPAEQVLAVARGELDPVDTGEPVDDRDAERGDDPAAERAGDPVEEPEPPVDG